MEVTFHSLSPSHEPALTNLIETCPDTGIITTGVKFTPDAFTVYSRLNRELEGVVASVSGNDDLVGACFFRPERVNFDGEERPAAYLFSLVVHPQWRREGIGKRLVATLMERAREKVGRGGVLYAHIQSRNTGSLRIFEGLFDRLTGRIDFGGLPIRTRPAKPDPALVVRTAREDELHSLATSLNRFYKDYDFFPSETEERLRDWLTKTHNHYYVATDRKGDILAGMGVFDQPHFQKTVIIDMPPSLRFLNRIIRIVPQDGMLRRLTTSRVWFAPGGLHAAQYLFETVRWELRGKGNMLGVGYDIKDGGLKKVFRRPFWLPMMQTTVAISYPKDSASLSRKGALAQNRPIYGNR